MEDFSYPQFLASVIHSNSMQGKTLKDIENDLQTNLKHGLDEKTLKNASKKKITEIEQVGYLSQEIHVQVIRDSKLIPILSSELVIGDVVLLAPSTFCLTFDGLIITSSNLYVDYEECHHQLYPKKALVAGSRIVQGYGTAVVICLGKLRAFPWRLYYDKKFVNLDLFDQLNDKNIYFRRKIIKYWNPRDYITFAVDIDSMVERYDVKCIWMENELFTKDFHQKIIKEHQITIGKILSLTTLESFESSKEGYFGSFLNCELLHFVDKYFNINVSEIRNEYITSINSCESKDSCTTTKTEKEQFHFGYYGNLISKCGQYFENYEWKDLNDNILKQYEELEEQGYLLYFLCVSDPSDDIEEKDEKKENGPNIENLVTSRIGNRRNRSTKSIVKKVIKKNLKIFSVFVLKPHFEYEIGKKINSSEKIKSQIISPYSNKLTKIYADKIGIDSSCLEKQTKKKNFSLFIVPEFKDDEVVHLACNAEFNRFGRRQIPAAEVQFQYGTRASLLGYYHSIQFSILNRTFSSSFDIFKTFQDKKRDQTNCEIM
eukprot:gene11662-4899_t